MDSFLLSDLNWPQKHICRIKTDIKMQEEPYKLHTNSTSSSCSNDCSNAKVDAKCCSKCQWFHLFTAFLFLLWDQVDSYKHKTSADSADSQWQTGISPACCYLSILCFKIWCRSNIILIPFSYSLNFDFDRIPPFTYQISSINQQTIFPFHQLRCALMSASPPCWGHKRLSHAGCA